MGRVEAIRPVAGSAREDAPSAGALVVIQGGRESRERPAAFLRDGRTEAGFVTQLLVGSDPTLQTSRMVRTRQAAAHYAEMARRLA